MSKQSFVTSFVVDRAPTEVFDAVTNVRGWWSEEVVGGTERPGDEFDYRYGDTHRCRIRVTESVPGRKVSWLVLDNHFSFTEDTAEWTGTTIDFEILEREDGGTELRFTHHGLVPEYECFEVCVQGWSFYVGKSLRSLIATGVGQPNGGGGRVRTAAERDLVAARDR
ncbi:SRPBCC domain-containing protein [Plantactinospora sp. GCM10030261]|uniref:SRPBCC family protein n=1 Tax=Plantactinospora sp. GCM10030261 TaxID=3273420 RepID=UPI00361CE454